MMQLHNRLFHFKSSSKGSFTVCYSILFFQVLLKPEKTLYFYGMPFFESRMKRNARKLLTQA